MKSEVFKTAWAFMREGLFNSFSEALKTAWAKVKLLTKLRKGIAYFSFTKVSGEVREAIGTLHTNNFDYTPKGNGKARKSNLLQVKFFDVEKRAFRSLKIQNLITIK